MKIVKNDRNTPLTLAEMEACQQFERSQQAGQALFRPQVAAGQPTPNCVVFLEETGRFAVTILEGPYTVQGGQWWRHEANGIQKPIDNPLEAVWQAGKSVRVELNRALKLNTYAIAVVWFPDMEEAEDILDEADGRSVHLCFGKVDLVQRLVSLPTEDQLQGHLSSRYIEQEVAALSCSSTAASEPANLAPTVGGKAGVLNVGPVETVNIYITIANGGDDDGPPLITVQGQ